MASTPRSMLRIISHGLHDEHRLNSVQVEKEYKGNPSRYMYSSIIQKRTRWASQWRRVEFDNMADFGRKATVTLPILGELITRAILVLDLPDLATPQQEAADAAEDAMQTILGPYWSWTNSIGHAICSKVDFQIGNQIVDTFDSRLLEILDEQEGPVEHFDSKNSLLGRDPSTYSQFSYQTNPTNQTVEILVPFWWNRGPGVQPLPIQALAKDKVQINIQFRSVQECVYTDARVNSLNPLLAPSALLGEGPMPNMAGCGFFRSDPAGVPIYDMSRDPTRTFFDGSGSRMDSSGSVLPGFTMPSEWHFQDAYWMIEYISLEEPEASAWRMADLQIPFEQHIALPIVSSNGTQHVRMPIAGGGLVRDMTWVAQRESATDYNAYFLFSRSLGLQENGMEATGSFLPWWPDARIPDWNYGDGTLRPAFATRNSDPIEATTFWARGIRRFEHEGPSLFRSLIPIMNCKRTPLIDRYIHRYDFGFWPTGGLAEALTRPRDEVRGFSNWDKIPQKELEIALQSSCNSSIWETDPTQPKKTYAVSVGNYITALLESDFASTTEGFRVDVRGGTPTTFGGNGATVRGILDYQLMRKQFGSSVSLIVRVMKGGSAGIVAKDADLLYHWIVVAGGGGTGTGAGLLGGNAASAVAIGYRGDGTQTHAATATQGGAGGGRLSDAGVGQSNGIAMPATGAWIFSNQRTGGGKGGDGYTGGGNGTAAGGGGGSYVSSNITQVETFSGLTPPSDFTGISQISVTPLRIRKNIPTFLMYVWLTSIQMLRITNGRGALMFSS
jgi:hypothetical protein